MDSQRTPGVMVRMSVSNQDLRKILGTIQLPDGGERSWCVACGASKGAKPIDRVSLPQEMTSKLLDPAALTSLVKNMHDLGQKAWCVACGAGKDASPLERFGDPADISDEVIDDLASKLLNAVRVG